MAISAGNLNLNFVNNGPANKSEFCSNGLIELNVSIQSARCSATGFAAGKSWRGGIPDSIWINHNEQMLLFFQSVVKGFF